MSLRNLFLSAIFLFTIAPAMAQRQLILLSGDKVIQRFRIDDTFHFKVSNSKTEHWGFLVEMEEFRIITSQDTIMLEEIEKVLLPGKPFVNRLGNKLIAVGGLYFLIDQVNNSIVHHHDFTLNANVWKPAVIIIGVGGIFQLFKKKWRRIGRSIRLISIDSKSRFYKHE